LLQLFRNNNPLNVLLLLIYALLLRLGIFINHHDISLEIWVNPLSKLLATMLSKVHLLNSITFSILSVLTITLSALYFNSILTKYKLNTKGVYLPALFFILIGSFINEFCFFTPALCALPFLIGACAKVFLLYKLEKASSVMFDSGLLISVASLFYFPYFVFVLFILIGFIVIRPFNIREYIIGILGVFIPLLFTATVYYWNHSLVEFYNSVFKVYAINALIINQTTIIETTIRLASVIIVFIWASFRITINYNKGVMQQRIIILLIYVFTFGGLCTTLVMQQNGMEHFIWISIPFSFIISIVVADLRKTRYAEMLHLCLLLLLLYFQYLYK
jgi:hypothetical protein